MSDRETRYVFESALGELIASGAILNVYLVEDGNGSFHVVARSVKGIDHRIKLKRGGVRTFKTLDAAAALIRGMGISRMTLHMSEFAPGNHPLRGAGDFPS